MNEVHFKYLTENLRLEQGELSIARISVIFSQNKYNNLPAFLTGNIEGLSDTVDNSVALNGLYDSFLSFCHLNDKIPQP
ncbi:hypothetical protein [Aureibacter tunicatorum]|uniref:Uncharacterized protein n=1 Tax=Aureibacter tunicatorum TaxID=866807 RepID=A0AAE4BS99_9BACT|nr:hypothetical protein [Aureibacter tunicatorum]MDR6241014.1 hypothetical protein [Aureibacter tunicatorum]BDD03792.1 hypothetical protein AUTU_12750 [Aureibacter tunicatorum]